MRTVEQRAQDFISSGEYSPTLKECYIAGAAEEHSLLTEWHDCATPPFHERRVLVKDEYDELQLAWYDVVAEEWQELSGGGVPMFWRDIHE